MNTIASFRNIRSFRVLLFCLLGSLCFSASAQINYSDFIGPEKRAYFQPSLHERRVVAAPPLREADVKFSRRIVRCIDARQKMNKQLEWPKQPLNQILYTGLWEGSILAYRSDSLMSFYNTDQFQKRGGYEKNVFISTSPTDPTEGYDTLIWIEYDYTSIHKFWVMEEWIFDAKYSVFKPQIIAIAPIFTPEFDAFKGAEQPLCWINMNDIRQTLANTEMFNRYNDAARLSYDDFFQMRIFDSYIVYESNVFDSYINNFEAYENDQVGALVKSDEIKNDLFIFEHDLWQF